MALALAVLCFIAFVSTCVALLTIRGADPRGKTSLTEAIVGISSIVLAILSWASALACIAYIAASGFIQ